MPYSAGSRLPGERASRLGHLEVLKSEYVNKLIKSFENRTPPDVPDNLGWQPIPAGTEPLGIVFGIDGSMAPVEEKTPLYKRMMFVKTALLRLDQYAISKVNKVNPHPLILKDILTDSALYHATVFPLRHVSIPGISTYDAIRQIIFESLKDASLKGWPMETLKWLAYRKWDGQKRPLPDFQCPHCEEPVATLQYDEEEGECPNSNCRGNLFITDYLGFHQIMGEDAAPDSLPQDYMNIHEILLLFSGIRYYWEAKKEVLKNTLFVKDGPLSIRAQYSKLVEPIRRFLDFTNEQGYPIYIIGQEKKGRFVEHLELIGQNGPNASIFIPSDQYIKKEVQQRPDTTAPYGQYTNFGAKIFVKISDYHKMVLNIPTGKFKSNPTYSDLIGADRIFATLPTILSNRYEGALLPIELAHGIASLSTYPSAQILKIFSEAKGS